MIGWVEVVGVGGLRRRRLVMVPILCQLCVMLAESPLGLHTYISSSWNQYLNSDGFDDDNTGSSASISGSHPTVAERGEQR
eukprot:scaffold25794_cov80-Skeletonema_marinoi.AAC.1